jgi:arylsulfate sulfotransferase
MIRILKHPTSKALFLILILFAACKKTDNTNTVKPGTDPVLTVTDKNNPTEGTILLAPFNTSNPNAGYLYILDKNGNIIKSRKTNSYAVNFQKWTINGTTRYTYTEFNPNGYHIKNVLYVSGDDVVLDENLDEIKRYNFLPDSGHAATQNLADSHDFIFLGDDHYIAMTYYEKNVTNIPAYLKPVPGVKVAAPVIQEVNNGQIVWEWDATDYPEFYTSSQEWNIFGDSVNTQDYIHMNSLFIDPKDNNLIISLRNLNQVIKVDRKSGNIIWRLGGINSDFNLTPEQGFLRQHHVTLTDSGKTLLIFDNGEIDQRPQTRIVEIQIDEANRKVLSFKATPVANNVFTQYMGSVQKRGNTYFIGGGTGNYVMEMEQNTGKILFQVKINQPTYRAFKY